MMMWSMNGINDPIGSIRNWRFGLGVFALAFCQASFSGIVIAHRSVGLSDLW